MKKYILLLLVVSALFSACTPQAKSMVGTWKLTGYGPETSPNPAVQDSGAMLTFKADGTLSGTSGCNAFGGEYKVQGIQITFGNLVSTLKACSDPLMEQEGAMYKVLSGTASYKINGDALTITNNGTVLLFSAASGQSYPYP